MAKGTKKPARKTAKKPTTKPAQKAVKSKPRPRSFGSARDQDLARVHALLMSGAERHFVEARKIIRQYPDDAHFLAASLEDMTKTWIENNRVTDEEGREVKKRDYLKAMFRIGQRTLQGLGPDDWYQRAEVARAFRYSGHYAKARIQFTKALRKIGGFGDAQDENRAKVIAEAAEFWAYLGYTGKALELLERIQGVNLKPWHLWVKAFVLHQAAFTDLNPIGTPAAPFGAVERYRQANDAIIAARNGITGKEAEDTYLLEAANWGGIANRLQQLGSPPNDVRAATDTARARMASFRGNALAQVNRYWSLRKEIRGLIPRRYLVAIDAPATDAVERAVGEWRRQMAICYEQNLKTASLGPTADNPPVEYGDGQPPNDADQDDDE